ncbi:MAG: hypothetical protein J7507_16000, partial [Pseudoxanthomonas sp.]|nr:hypothetical protein [Pseudoxanthomonas sp.]
IRADSRLLERVRKPKQGQRQVVRGGRSALFRKDNPRAPFMRVETREDGVFVARFPATPGEVIVGRVYSVDPRTRRFVYGAPMETTCRQDSVSVGEPEMAAGPAQGK